MRITILFGGTNKERLVAVATAQAVHSALPDADLGVWRDGSSYGLIFVNAKQDLVAVRHATKTEEYLIEPFIAGIEATCGVLEQLDGALLPLPTVEIIPAEGAFDYRAKYLAKATQEICP